VATLHNSGIDEAATISVVADVIGRCKVTIIVGPTILRRQLTATFNGNRSSISGPPDLIAVMPLPTRADGVAGCPLLPFGTRPAPANWTRGGKAASIQYTDFQAAGANAYPASVTETVDGQPRLEIKYTSAQGQAFTDADFALPPLPKPKLKSAPQPGGAQ